MSRRPDQLHVLCDTPAWRLVLRTLQRRIAST
jgi:hypothetical protein